MKQGPIIVLGPARSGAGLLSRILAASDDHFLITDQPRHLKEHVCPEDRSGISDELLWWKYFEFEAWDTGRKAPSLAAPIFDAGALRALHDRYHDMAKGRRLVIKNSHSLARLGILKQMFPQASFVFSLRAPWPTIQSATIDAGADHIARTAFVNSFANDLLLRAAATWAEAIDILGRQHDDRWIVVRYEDLVAKPKDTVFRLYHRLGLDEFEAAVRATSLLAPRQRDYSFLKGELLVNRHLASILSLVLPRARSLGYPGFPVSLKGSGLRYLFARWSAKHVPAVARKAPQPAPRRVGPVHGDAVDLVEAGGFLPSAG